MPIQKQMSLPPPAPPTQSPSGAQHLLTGLDYLCAPIYGSCQNCMFIH
uniref:Uncharacterized protein n=1 Tax=Arundo donax TaxID=35708 RepID=A0A0A9GUN5_ARUDO